MTTTASKIAHDARGSRNIDPAAFTRDYLKPVHRVGTATALAVFLALFIPSILLYLLYGQFPSWQTIVTGFGLAMTYAVPFYFSEPISYYPIVGNAGWYMISTTGNGSNLRVPCAAVALEVAGAKEGSMEGELVAAIGIATSVLISIPAILIGALAIGAIQQIFPPWLLDAFNKYLLPAVFGAVWGQFILRGWKYAPISIALFFLCYFLKVPGAWTIVITVLGTMLAGALMLKFFKIEA